MALEVKYLPEDAELPAEILGEDRKFRRKVLNGKVFYFEVSTGKWLHTHPAFFSFEPTGREPLKLMIGDRTYKLHREQLYIPENATPKEIEALFDYLARSRYEERFLDLDFNLRVYHQLFDLALRDASNQDIPLLLDYGCGSGVAALAAQKYRHRLKLVGVDISTEMVKISREKGLPSLKIGGNQDLPFRAGSFDAVVMAFVADFLNGIQPYRWIYRVLRKHGRIAFNLYRPSAGFQEHFSTLLTETGYSSIEFSDNRISSPAIRRELRFIAAVKPD